MSAKRTELTKKMRFEVFKRDKFTCQYCGREAPDVVLNVDHITPVSKGGTNDLANLITSCFDCNSGKSDRELSDDAVVKKQKAQLDMLQERRKQLEMVREWQVELTTETLKEADIVSEVIEILSGSEPNENGKANLKKIIKQFGVNEVCEAARIAFTQYDTSTDSGWEFAFSKIGGICYRRNNVTCWDCVHFERFVQYRGVECTEICGIRSTKHAKECDSFKRSS